jgi:formylglycine-generating enzyme required for sulfatase activity
MAMLALIPLLLLQGCGRSGDGQVIARVEGEAITAAELAALDRLAAAPTSLGDLVPRSAPSRGELLAELIKERLLATEAARLGLETGPGRPPREVLRDWLARDLAPTPEDLTRYYREHPQRYRRRKQLRFHHLLLEDGAPEQGGDLVMVCDEATRRDPHGHVWGDIGWLQPSSTPWNEEHEWHPDELGGQIEWRDDRGRAHRIQLMHHRPGGRFDFEQVREDCRLGWVEEQTDAAMRRLLLRLVRGARIEILDSALRETFDPLDVVRAEPGLSVEALLAEENPGQPPEGMVRVPGGTLLAGSTDAEIDERVEICMKYVGAVLGPEGCAREKFADEILHEVTVPDLYVDRTEVTWKEYEAFVEATGHRPAPEWIPREAGRPVSGVSQEDACAFCRWQGKRLPTADEWEYAARGSERRRYPWGNEPPDGTRANFCERNCTMPWRNMDHNDGYRGAAPVGSYPAGATPEGLLDMAGNIREWTATRRGDEAMVKGGGFENAIDDMIPADVRWNRVTERRFTIGFRCVRDAEPREAPP